MEELIQDPALLKELIARIEMVCDRRWRVTRYDCEPIVLPTQQRTVNRHITFMAQTENAKTVDLRVLHRGGGRATSISLYIEGKEMSHAEAMARQAHDLTKWTQQIGPFDELNGLVQRVSRLLHDELLRLARDEEQRVTEYWTRQQHTARQRRQEEEQQKRHEIEQMLDELL